MISMTRQYDGSSYNLLFCFCFYFFFRSTRQHNICHRDLKLENILLDESKTAKVIRNLFLLK